LAPIPLSRGEELAPVDLAGTRAALQRAYAADFRSVAIVFMHGHRYPDHEQQVAQIAREIGFTPISQSHRVAPAGW
jgi:5-oxoprolinase (ATP-hydrolysing)